MTASDAPTPPRDATNGTALAVAAHEQLLQTVLTQLRTVTTRLEAVEAELRDARAVTTATPPGSTAASPATSTIPTWRTKNGRQAGWQPARS